MGAHGGRDGPGCHAHRGQTVQDRPVQSHAGRDRRIDVDRMLVAGEPVERRSVGSDVHRAGPGRHQRLKRRGRFGRFSAPASDARQKDRVAGLEVGGRHLYLDDREPALVEDGPDAAVRPDRFGSQRLMHRQALADMQRAGAVVGTEFAGCFHRPQAQRATVGRQDPQILLVDQVALNTADIPIGASAGAGLYFVGVLLDRISQPEDSDDRRGLLARIRGAWATRADPAVPAVPGMQADTETPVATAAPAAPELAAPHRIGAAAALIGGLIAALSVLLTWGNDSGLLSGYARFDDTDLPGAHSGLDATGGSWFGIVFGLIALVVAFGGASALWRPRSRDKFLAGGGAFLAAGLVLASLAAAYLTVAPRGENYSHGTGVWLGLLGALVVLGGGVGAILGMRSVDEPARAGTRELAGMVVLALFLGFAGASGSWILDQRSDAAQIAAELAAEAEGADQGGLAAEVLAEALAETRRVVVRGLDSDGPRIGYIVLALTVASMAATLGRLVRSHAAQRYLGLVMFGLGCAIAAIGAAWIATFVRLAVPAVSPGASAFLVVVGGLIIAARGWRVNSAA